MPITAGCLIGVGYGGRPTCRLGPKITDSMTFNQQTTAKLDRQPVLTCVARPSFLELPHKVKPWTGKPSADAPPEFALPQIFAKSVRNETLAVINRTIGDDGTSANVDSEAFQILQRTRSTLTKFLVDTGVESGPLPMKQVLKPYCGAKLARYQRAAVKLSKSGGRCKDSDCRITAFLKVENTAANKTDPVPRLIQARRPPYALELATFLKGVEKGINVMTGPETDSDERVVAKGLTGTERAAIFVKLWERHGGDGNAVCVSTDASKFDMHVRADILKLEHQVYLGLYKQPADGSKPRSRFAWLLRQQLVNCGTTSCGVKYVTDGNRMSGDMNTSCGNCLIMTMLVMAFCRIVKRAEPDFIYDTLGDGDDDTIIFNRKYVETFLSLLVPTFLDWGFKMKVDKVAYRLCDILFCQHKLVQINGVYQMILNPLKIIGWGMASQRLTNKRLRVPLLRCRALSLLALNKRVPVIQEYALAILRNCDRVDPNGKIAKLIQSESSFRRLMFVYDSFSTDDVDQHLQDLRNNLPLGSAISCDDRLSFAAAFSMDQGMQERYESFFRTWKFDIGV